MHFSPLVLLFILPAPLFGQPVSAEGMESDRPCQHLVFHALGCAGSALATEADHGQERAISLRIGGWVQPRYEFTYREGAENLSSFYLRRVRVDVRGSALTPQLTFRVMPELARTASMRDAWVNYAFSSAAQVRAGQFQLPFQWHRAIAGRTLHFAERGPPSETFGFPTGRDIGVMLHGAGAARTWTYGLGIFDGAGRNVQFSNSDGHVASARLAAALFGAVPVEETDFSHSPAAQLAVGVGIQAANKNEIQPWDLGRSPTGNRRADWVTATADVSLRWRGLSVAADGYLRSVDPDDPAVGSYSGRAFMVTAGYALLPGLLEVVGRFSDLRLDVDDPATRASQWGAGVNLYHRGHDLKTRIQYLHDSAEAAPGDTGSFLVELHIQF